MLPLTGAITIPARLSFTLHSDLKNDTPLFTLTCISTGGPATTVTWINPDFEVVTTGNMTVLNNAQSAECVHTLNVTGRLGGLYTCTVENSKPSSDSIQLSIKGTELINMLYMTVNTVFCTAANPPMELTVTTSEGSSTISVFWSGPIGGDAVTGYLVYYHHPNHNVIIINRTSNDLSATFTELTTTQRVYTVSIQALSEHLPSIVVGPVTARG